jgi:phage anti-repressor protein
MNTNISLKDFLKLYTGISYKFIDEYCKFYEMTDNKKFGIDLNDVIKYLEIKYDESFITNFRKHYKENIDYKYYLINRSEKREKEKKYSLYLLSLDTFEKICMMSKTKKANSVRDYFIILRKFIFYYKNHISNMIINESIKKPNGNIYIILANKNKNIFKIGKSKDIRERLKNYATGKDKHPDIKFIILVDNKSDVEKCVKKITRKYQFKPNQEIYKVDIEQLKKIYLNALRCFRTI